jgi:hypothetical protein
MQIGDGIFRGFRDKRRIGLWDAHADDGVHD